MKREPMITGIMIAVASATAGFAAKTFIDTKRHSRHIGRGERSDQIDANGEEPAVEDVCMYAPGAGREENDDPPSMSAYLSGYGDGYNDGFAAGQASLKDDTGVTYEEELIADDDAIPEEEECPVTETTHAETETTSHEEWRCINELKNTSVRNRAALVEDIMARIPFSHDPNDVSSKVTKSLLVTVLSYEKEIGKGKWRALTVGEAFALVRDLRNGEMTIEEMTQTARNQQRVNQKLCAYVEANKEEQSQAVNDICLVLEHLNPDDVITIIDQVRPPLEESRKADRVCRVTDEILAAKGGHYDSFVEAGAAAVIRAMFYAMTFPSKGQRKDQGAAMIHEELAKFGNDFAEFQDYVESSGNKKAIQELQRVMNAAPKNRETFMVSAGMCLQAFIEQKAELSGQPQTEPEKA